MLLAGLVFGLATIVFVLNISISTLEERLKIAQEENNRQAEEMRVEHFNMMNLAKENELLRNESIRYFELKSKDKKNETVRVFHNKDDGQVFLSVVKMTPLIKGQYQLWNIKGTQFESLGVIEAGLKGLQKLKKTNTVYQLIITEEEIGGAEKPSKSLW